jgi:hypothetical protein
LKHIAVWLALAVAFGSLVCLLSRVPQLALLANRGQTTGGVVTAVHPREHCSVTVRYIVQGRNYEQSFAPYGWNMGANVTVYYQANHPANAELADPREILENNLVLCAFAAIFFPSIILASTRFSVPQLTTTVIVAFTIISIGIEAYQGNIHGPQWISAALIMAGVSLMLVRVLRVPHAGWRTVAKSKLFILGLLLVVAGLAPSI